MRLPADSSPAVIIRAASAGDYDELVDIWLRASLLAHDFVPASFWREQTGEMKNRYLPASESYLLQVWGKTRAFVSLADDRVAALFVDPSAQGAGYGRQLIGFVQRLRKTLTLCVYARNARAVSFYQAAGFSITAERPDAETGWSELVMEWRG